MPSNYYFELATWHRIHLLYEKSVLLELDNFRQQVQDKAPVDRLIALLKQRRGHHLAALVEDAKIELSDRTDTRVNLQTLFADSSAELHRTIEHCVLTRELLQQSLQRDLDAIFSALDTTLSQAGVSPDQIDTVFTTGGSTALPMVTSRIQHKFPDAHLVSGDLYNSVGSGLLMEARKRYQ